MKYTSHFLLLFVISLNLIQTHEIIEEFEEITINETKQTFIYKNSYSEEVDYNPEIMIICLNEYFDPNIESYIEISNTKKKQFVLAEAITIIISRDDELNEGKGDYKIIFKNYKGGKFYVYNSIHSYPLKDFSRFYYLYYKGDREEKFLDLKFHSEVLTENIDLIINEYSDFKLFQINDTDTTEIKINQGIIKLLKDYQYKLECNISLKYSSINIFIGKREIQKYNGALDKKSFYIGEFSSYFFINFNEMEKQINESFFFSDFDYYKRKEYEIAYLNSDNISDIDLDTIEYDEKIQFNYKGEEQCAIFSENIKSNYVLLKITYSTYNSFYFYFHIYEECISESIVYTKKLLLNNSKEALLIFEYEDDFEIIFSNNTNIQSLRTLQTNFMQCSTENKVGYRNLYYVNILPSSTPSEISAFQRNLNVKIFKNDYSLSNFLHLYFEDNEKSKYFWLFENNNSILYFNQYFGDAKIYYSEKLGYETLYNLIYDKNEHFNLLNDTTKVEGPFFLYIDYNYKTFLELIINDENYTKINFNDDDTALKFLEANKIYQLENIENITTIEIDDKVEKDIKIIDIISKEIKYTLNKENSVIGINETFNNLGIISGEDTYIKIYYNIHSLYMDNIYVIEFSKENIGQDMIINITYNDINELNYFCFYGYKDLVPSNLIKINFKGKLLLINNPYDKLDLSQSSKNFYIYIFADNIEYKINYINKYKISNYFTRITPMENFYFTPEKMYNSDYSILEILFCKNNENKMELKITDYFDDETDSSIINNSIEKLSNPVMVKFDYNYEFILISGEARRNNFKINEKVNFYIPQANEEYITLLIKNDHSNYDISFTIILVEEKENINLMESLDNPCFLFQFLENDTFLDYNYLILSESSDSKFKYIEIDIKNKFINKKNIYVKIMAYSNIFKSAIFSGVKKIYMENIVNENKIKDVNEDDNAINIEENKEYSINNNEFIFKYNLQKNHLNILPIIFLTYYNTYNLAYYVETEIEIINPLFQTFKYKMDDAEVITLNSTIIKDYGDYYFIFRNCLGVKFYIHNTINIFPLNSGIENYQTTSLNNASADFISFSLNLEKDKYIYIKNACKFYFYSKKLNKIIDEVNNWVGTDKKYPADDYFIFSAYEDCSFDDHEIAIYSNHFLIDDEIPFSKEIVSGEVFRIMDGTIYAVLDLNNSQKNSYITLGNIYKHMVFCIESKNIDDVVKEGGSGSSRIFNSHFIDPLSFNCPAEKPYIFIEFKNTVFELIKDFRNYKESQDLILQKGNETIGIKLNKTDEEKDYYYFVFSDHENLRYLNQTKIDNSKILFQRAVNTLVYGDSYNFEFKLNLCEDKETNLKIRILEDKNNTEIINIKSNETCEFLELTNHQNEIKYFINLLKTDVIVTHFELKGNVQIYLLKDELNDISIEKILNSDSIDESIFELQNSTNIIINPYKIMAIKYLDQEISQYFCMNSISQDFIINNSIKNIQANKKYILKSGTKIILEKSMDANIKLYNYNSEEIFTLNKENYTFENEKENVKLISDKNTVIYLYYKIKNDSKLYQFQFKREYVNKKVFIIQKDYAGTKYYYGYGYENYESIKKYELKFDNIMKIYNPYQNQILPDDIIYSIYSESKINILYDLDTNFRIGNNLLEPNKYIATLDFKNPYGNKNLFYQYIQCGEYSPNNVNLILNGYDNEQIFFSNIEFFENVEYLFLYYYTDKTSIFNFYFSQYNIYDYENLNRNSEPTFNIYFINRTLIQVEISPIYVDYELDYYFIYIIGNDSSFISNLNNMCYIQDIITNKINENYKFEKISLKGDSYVNISLNISTLEDNYTIYSNIYAQGNILDNITQLLIYEAKSHLIQADDFPEDSDTTTDEKPIPSDKGGDNDSDVTTLLLAILIPSIIIIIGIIIFLFVCKMRKSKGSIENEVQNTRLLEMNDK